MCFFAKIYICKIDVFCSKTPPNVVCFNYFCPFTRKRTMVPSQSGISLNLRTGPAGHATLFNQWEGALVLINKRIKTSPQSSKIFKKTDGVDFPARRGLSRRGKNERKERERVSLRSLIFASSWETSASREGVDGQIKDELTVLV